jgi:hypothetical protein
MPESAFGVVVELVVQPAVQAKKPRTAAIARISRRMRGLPSPAGDSLVMFVLVLEMLSKNRGRSETGEPNPTSCRVPFPYWSNRCDVIIRLSVLERSPPVLRYDHLSGQQYVRGGGICLLPHISFAVRYYILYFLYGIFD